MENIRVIVASLILHQKQSLSRSTFRFVVLVQPILYSYLLFMMFRNSTSSNVGEQIVLSAGIINLWSSVVFSSAGDIDRERYMGTLELIYSTPSDFRVIFLGKILGNIILGMFSVILSLICVVFVFGIQIQIANYSHFIISSVVTILSFISISLFAATMLTLSRVSGLLMNCLEYPIFILCGISFPISILPEWTRFLSYILPPTWAARLLRESIVSGTHTLFANDLIFMIVLIVFYFLISILLFKYIDILIRKRGTLGVF
ncbi:ABC transporter permease [Paenibacillus wynnii]|uniref:Transport permease protein n=1 Tax=Paenibacillus wynnii TaxID=268407 RepID=A0A098M3E0_9BACL|nr:ABC transporter permease [Paenibacillus wynnii]KGE16516.1 hypothetical protein PWYN_17455 [Paenibacillus wynnii]